MFLELDGSSDLINEPDNNDFGGFPWLVGRLLYQFPFLLIKILLLPLFRKVKFYPEELF